MDSSTLMIIEPNTRYNDSSKWRVADRDNFTRYVNGAITSYGFVAHETRESAEAALDRAQR
jgi:hypothetical protein